ncbi:MAG: YraN family protein [Alphaproteobacteria bacterium]
MSARRGRGAYLSGLAAEEQAARAYRKRGAEILARRHRNEAGEIDIILLEDGILVFVEVKQRKNRAELAESITERQWQSLGLAATHYMMTHSNETGPIRGCRFDAVLIGADGRLEIIENARSFDEH